MSITPQELREAYHRGENIMALVRSKSASHENNEQTIELSYDLQAGSYIRYIQENAESANRLYKYANSLTEIIANLGGCQTLLEAGVGEATTLKYVVECLHEKPSEVHGFDLCWSRVAVGNKWLSASRGDTAQISLITGSLLHVPYLDNSFDIVFTSHALEPNRGREEDILAGLYRVASRYIILLEPGYELASDEARARMDAHGYVRNIPGTAERLGMKVVEHRLFPHAANALNPTAITIIEKNPSANSVRPTFACPQFFTPLMKQDGCFYSEESMRAYPIIQGIPCLRPEYAIIASKLAEVAL